MRYYHRKYRTGDAHTFVQPSRFLTAEVRKLLDETAHGDAVVGEGQVELAHVSPSKSIEKKLNQLWGD